MVEAMMRLHSLTRTGQWLEAAIDFVTRSMQLLILGQTIHSERQIGRWQRDFAGVTGLRKSVIG